jgi:hypothetical protein
VQSEEYLVDGALYEQGREKILGKLHIVQRKMSITCG